MAKNRAFIEYQKVLYRRVHQVVPEVYAGVALALHEEFGWGYNRINRLFARSQELWDECGEQGIDMVQKCYEKTGIELRRKD